MWLLSSASNLFHHFNECVFPWLLFSCACWCAPPKRQQQETRAEERRRETKDVRSPFTPLGQYKCTIDHASDLVKRRERARARAKAKESEKEREREREQEKERKKKSVLSRGLHPATHRTFRLEHKYSRRSRLHSNTVHVLWARSTLELELQQSTTILSPFSLLFLPVSGPDRSSHPRHKPFTGIHLDLASSGERAKSRQTGTNNWQETHRQRGKQRANVRVTHENRRDRERVEQAQEEEEEEEKSREKARAGRREGKTTPGWTTHGQSFFLSRP